MNSYQLNICTCITHASMISIKSQLDRENKKMASSPCHVIVTLTVFLNSFAGYKCQLMYNNDIGPQNITRRSGETNVYIPCSFPGIYFPMWRINGIYYEAFSLPEGLIPASYGLLIPTVGLNMDGWTFQCLASTGYRVDVYFSTVGVLTVENQTASGLSLPSVQVTKFDLDHQRLLFETKYKLFAWRSANSSCPLFRMNTSTCDGTIIHKWPEGYIQGTQVNVTSENTSNQDCLNFFKINAVNERNGPICQEMKQSFQIKRTDLTMDMQVPLNGFCVHFLTPRGSFPYIALPQNNTSSTDCICGYPVLETCSTPKDCSCGNDTIFSESLDVCSLDQLNNVTYYAICFYNLTKEMNNTYVHMFELIKECHECSGPMQSVRRNVPSRLYFKSFKIVAVLPNEPNITVNESTGKICFQSKNSEGILLTNFFVIILDVTKQAIFNKTVDVTANNNSVVCISVGNLLQDPLCSPFNVTVEAHNQHGKTVSYNVTKPFNNSDVCSCISRNVTLLSESLIQVTNDESKVEMVINCSTTYKTSVWLNVSFGIKNLNESILCSKDQHKYLSGLTCDHEYHVSVFWYHSGENQYHLPPCVLAQNISYTHKHKKCSGKSPELSLGGIIGIVIAILVFVLFVLGSGAGVRSCYQKSSSSQTNNESSPRFSELTQAEEK